MAIEAGRYTAKLKSYGITTLGEKKTPVWEMEFEPEGMSESVYFKIWLDAKNTAPKTEKGKDSRFQTTLNTLRSMGAWTTLKITDFSKGTGSGVLRTDMVYSITVANQTKKDVVQVDKDGVPYVEVVWVNDPNSNKKEMLAETDAITVMQGLDLGMNEAIAAQYEPPTNVAANATGSDVPF